MTDHDRHLLACWSALQEALSYIRNQGFFHEGKMRYPPVVNRLEEAVELVRARVEALFDNNPTPPRFQWEYPYDGMQVKDE